MNYLQDNFFYLSQIIGKPVIDYGTNKTIGRVSDVVAGVREMYPKLNALIVRKSFGVKRFYVPWKNVKEIKADQRVIVEGEFQEYVNLPENSFCLKEIFWDRQVVDISGSKVVRVNDLHILHEHSNFWIVHMDIGFKGLVRRLGWSKFVEYVSKWLFSYELQDKFISWKYVQPITAENLNSSLTLKVPQNKLSEIHPADLAEILIGLGLEERVTLLTSLDKATAAKAFNELPIKIRSLTAALLRQDQLAGMINEMPMDEAVDMLGKLTKKKANALFGILPQDKVVQMKKLLSYSDKVAGSIMNTDYITVRSSVTVNAVWDKIKAELKHKESIYYIYVLDENDTLAGVVTLRQLLTAQNDKLVSEVMRKRVTRVKVETSIEDVAQYFLKYDFMVLPVVDKQNKLIGTITMKDAFESVFPVIREEVEDATQ